MRGTVTPQEDKSEEEHNTHASASAHSRGTLWYLQLPHTLRHLQKLRHGDLAKYLRNLLVHPCAQCQNPPPASLTGGTAYALLWRDHFPLSGMGREHWLPAIMWILAPVSLSLQCSLVLDSALPARPSSSDSAQDTKCFPGHRSGRSLANTEQACMSRIHSHF